MGRSFNDGERSSIGYKYMQEAMARIDAAMKVEANLVLGRFTVDEITEMLFDDYVIQAMRTAFTYAGDRRTNATYALQIKPTEPHRVSLHLTFPNMLAPMFSLVRPRNAERLFETIEQAEALREKWAKVRAVLAWCDNYATPSAARALWPPVMELCGKAPSLRKMSVAPDRYADPPRLTDMLPLLRETPATVASMVLVPKEAEQRRSNGIGLGLHARTFNYGEARVNAPSTYFYL